MIIYRYVWWLQPSYKFVGSYTFLYCWCIIYINISCCIYFDSHIKYLWIEKHDRESIPSSQAKTDIYTKCFLCKGFTKTRSLITPDTYHFRCTARRAAERQYIQFHWTLSLPKKHFWYHQVIAHPADFHITQNLCLFLTESHARVH